MTKGGTTPYSLFTLEVKKKIQSMIDNYCDHEWYTNVYNYFLHCQKCGKTIKNDKHEKILNDN